MLIRHGARRKPPAPAVPRHPAADARSAILEPAVNDFRVRALLIRAGVEPRGELK